MLKNYKIDAIWGFSAQALRSIINLMIGLTFIKFLKKDEYGLYGIGFAVLILFLGLANGAIFSQMTIFVAQKKKLIQLAYCGSVLIILNAIIVCIVVIAVITAFLLKGYFGGDYYHLVLTVAFSIPGYLNIEFLRRYYYLCLFPKRVFILDIIIGLMLLLLLVAVVSMDLENPQLWILLGNGLFTLIVSVVGIKFIKFPAHESFALIKNTLLESWRNGVWASAGGLVAGLQQQAYVFLLAGIKGTEMVAEANTARLFLSPLGVLVAGFNRVFMPRISNTNFKEGRLKASKLGINIMIILIFILLLYLLFLYVSFNWIQVFFKMAAGDSFGNLILLWGAVYLLQAVKFSATQLLQIFKKYSLITIVNSIVVLFWFVACVFLVKIYGAIGVIGAMVLAEILLVGIYWITIFYLNKSTFDS